MAEIKSRLQGGVQEKKKIGAERLKSILEEVKKKGIVTEGELSKATGVDKKTLSKYVEYLSENGLVTVNKRWFKDSEISISGGRNVRIPVKRGAAVEKEKDVIEQAPEKLAEEESKTADPSAQEVKIEPPIEASAPAKNGQKPAEPAAAEVQPKQPASTAPISAPSPEQKPENQAVPSGGEKLMPETEEELKEVAKSLVTDFIGVMRLFGESQSQSYTAGLLIDKGDVVAASFEHMDTVNISFGDEAMAELQTKFSGTKGGLEIFEMSEEDFNESLRSNINLMLTSPIKLSSLNIRIKSHAHPEPPPEHKSMLSGLTGMFSQAEAEEKEERQKMLKEMQKRKVEKISGGLNLIDFARQLTLDPLKAKRFEELRKTRQKDGPPQPSAMDPKKAARLGELRMMASGAIAKGVLGAASNGGMKEERLERMREMRKTQPITVEKEVKTPVKTVQEGKKIETTIDRLYELVESQGKVKLNDALAARLKVNKTQIEEWAMILEEHNLLELRYPTIGEPEIVSNKIGKAEKGEDADVRKKK